MTAPQDTPTLPYRIHLLDTVLAIKMFAFATPEARETFLVAWTTMREDGDVPAPVEGTDYLLEGPAS